MCGISAWLSLGTPQQNGHTNASEKHRTKLATQLDCSVESMRHRGPDAKGVWVSPDGTAGLGHVRLSTRDLSCAGTQPLHSETDGIHVVVNGELYYDPQLRSDLEADYTFHSTSDSEMVIALYKRYGNNFLQHLRGEFSLVVYDSKRKVLVAARDRFGVKPLHYGIFDGKLLIATQCKGVVELLERKSSLKWDAKCFGEGGGHYGNRTLFNGIRKFPAGYSLVIRQGQDEKICFDQYWSTIYPENAGGVDKRPAEDLVNELRPKLLESVRLRLESSDVPVGILLSGGVDSSAVAGMAAHLAKQRVEAGDVSVAQLPTCFTIGFPDDDELDESAIAQRTAEHLGLPIEKVIVDEQVLADEFDEACWLGEALMWDLQHIAKKALSRHISSRGLKVVLNGDGGDELFGGYSFYASDRLLADDERRAANLQNVDRAHREKLRAKYAGQNWWFGLSNTDVEHEDKMAKELGLPPAFCNMAVSRHDEWLLPEVRASSSPFQAIHDLLSEKELKAMATYHPMHRGMLAWSKSILPNMVIAAISDGAEMAHGVESRPPFLDHVLAEFAQTLSADMLVHLEVDKAPIEKWLFREAVKPFVTEEVYRKRKHAFAAPFKWKVGGPLYKKLTSLISRENIERLGFADWEKCKDIVDRSFCERDQLVFRKVIWLAQIISIGLQFGVQPWRKEALMNGSEA